MLGLHEVRVHRLLELHALDAANDRAIRLLQVFGCVVELVVRGHIRLVQQLDLLLVVFVLGLEVRLVQLQLLLEFRNLTLKLLL